MLYVIFLRNLQVFKRSDCQWDSVTEYTGVQGLTLQGSRKGEYSIFLCYIHGLDYIVETSVMSYTKFLLS